VIIYNNYHCCGCCLLFLFPSPHRGGCGNWARFGATFCISLTFEEAEELICKMVEIRQRKIIGYNLQRYGGAQFPPSFISIDPHIENIWLILLV
jgi:hypothetical protein